MNDKIQKLLSKELSFRASVVVGTGVVREMQSIQNTYPIATMAVGRTMIAAALMASHLKADQLVSLYFRGNGPMEMFFAEADHEGHVRGYTPQPQIQAGDMLVGTALGKGTLTVVHSHPQLKAPQRGTVEIQTGEVGDDVAFYLFQSQQIKSLLAVGVMVNSYGMVQGAAGILIELLPGHTDEIVEKLEKNFKDAGSISEMVASGGGIEEIIAKFLKDLPVKEMDHPHELTYQCRCSKERLGNALALLGHMEVENMIQENEAANARCEFCGRNYTIEIEDLKMLLEKLRSGPTH